MKRYKYEILTGVTGSTFQVPIFLEASVDEMGVMVGFDGEFEQIEQYANFTYKSAYGWSEYGYYTTSFTDSGSCCAVPAPANGTLYIEEQYSQPTVGRNVYTNKSLTPGSTFNGAFQYWRMQREDGQWFAVRIAFWGEITNVTTCSPAVSPTPTRTPTGTPCPENPSPTPSITPSNSVPVTPSRTVTPTPTPTPSVTQTACPITPTPTPSLTPTPSISVTPSVTPSRTPSVTPSRTVTPTASPSVTPSVSPTRTPSVTPSRTPSVTPSRTPTPSVSPSNAMTDIYINNDVFGAGTTENIEYVLVNGFSVYSGTLPPGDDVTVQTSQTGTATVEVGLSGSLSSGESLFVYRAALPTYTTCYDSTPTPYTFGLVPFNGNKVDIVYSLLACV